jgi:hypothetical protein
MRSWPILALALCFVACSSQPTAEEKRKLEEEIAPKDVDPTAPPPTLGKVKPGEPAGPASDDLPPPDPDGTITKGPKGVEEPAKPGVAATVLYIMEVKDDSKPTGVRPAAMIFSSDPESPYYGEPAKRSRIVKHLKPHEMLTFLGELDAAGLSRLPLDEEASDKVIDAGRAVYVFRKGEAMRRGVRKSELKTEAQAVAFTKVEKRLVAVARNTR